MDPISAVRSVAMEQADQSFHLPKYVHGLIYVFDHVHRFYRRLKIYKLFNKSQNNPQAMGAAPLVYGAVLNEAVNHTTAGNFALNIALITRCTADILKRYENISKALFNLKNAFNERFPTPQPNQLDHHYTILSPTLHQKLKNGVHSLYSGLEKTAKGIANVFKEVAHLTFSFRDIQLITQNDPEHHFYACTELVHDLMVYKQRLSTDQGFLLDEMTTGSEIGDALLAKIGANQTVSGIRRFLQPLFDNQIVQQVYQNVNHVFQTHFTAVTNLNPNFHHQEDPNPRFKGLRAPPWCGQPVEFFPEPIYAPEEKRTDESLNPHVSTGEMRTPVRTALPIPTSISAEKGENILTVLTQAIHSVGSDFMNHIVDPFEAPTTPKRKSRKRSGTDKRSSSEKDTPSKNKTPGSTTPNSLTVTPIKRTPKSSPHKNTYSFIKSPLPIARRLPFTEQRKEQKPLTSLNALLKLDEENRKTRRERAALRS